MNQGERMQEKPGDHQTLRIRTATPARILARYFDRVLNCRFVLDGETLSPSEVFNETGFLPLVADAADKLSREVFDGGISIEIQRDDAGLIGRRLILPAEIDQLLLNKLRRGAEIVFGEEPNREIDLTSIYQYCWSPEAAGYPEGASDASRQRP